MQVPVGVKEKKPIAVYRETVYGENGRVAFQGV